MILVTGATGTSGREIVKQLLATGAKARALARNREKALAILGAGVEIAEGDLSRPETLDEALKDVERVLLLSSPDPRQVELQGNLIDAAKRAGSVKHVVKFSAIGADINSPAMLLKWHGETEKQLEASGMAYTHLQPNAFMQNLLGFQSTIAAQGVLYAPLKDARISLVDVRDIAAVAVKTLTEPGHESKAYAITGPEALSYAEVAEKLSAALGRKVTYVDVPPEAARQGMIGAGLPEWLADAVNELHSITRAGDSAHVTNVVSEVAGKDPITFDQFAHDYAPAFRGQ